MAEDTAVAPHRVERRRLLAHVSLFSSLDDADLDKLLKLTSTRHLEEGEVLFRKGEPGRQLYGVLEGRLKVVNTGADGKDVVFGLMGPGEVIGEISLIDGYPRSAAVVALEACELLTLHRRDLNPFIERHPKFAFQLAGVLAGRLRRLSEHTEDSLFHSLRIRLAKKLFSLMKEYGDETPEGIFINVRLAQQDLADLVGGTRESINKQLRSWEEEGVVKLQRTKITVLLPDALEAIANYVSL